MSKPRFRPQYKFQVIYDSDQHEFYMAKLIGDMDSECPRCHFLWKKADIKRAPAPEYAPDFDFIGEIISAETCPQCKHVWKPGEILKPDFARAMAPEWWWWDGPWG